MEWSRCPGCKSLCELKEGCAHITCVCKYEHCYLCGSDWSVFLPFFLPLCDESLTVSLDLVDETGSRRTLKTTESVPASVPPPVYSSSRSGRALDLLIATQRCNSLQRRLCRRRFRRCRRRGRGGWRRPGWRREGVEEEEEGREEVFLLCFLSVNLSFWSYLGFVYCCRAS